MVMLKDVERSRPGADPASYDVQIAPLNDRNGRALGAKISFLDVTRATRLAQELHHANHEIEAAYEELQSTSEELETTNEELRSTVEELETTNEELQSTNEELQTMNEELQSTNAELQTVNDELRQRGEELASANGFLASILASLDSAAIVIDRDLRIEVWSRVAERLFGLRAEEVRGKSLLGLDVLPLEKLHSALRGCFAGDLVGDLSADVTDRRGRVVRCRVRCSRLVGDSAGRGVLITIDGTVAEPVISSLAEP
jgi:two-component system CheB/CheR fusion protein